MWECAIVSAGPLGNFVPETRVLDVPFLFEGYDHARGVLDGEIGQELLALFPRYGLEGGGLDGEWFSQPDYGLM